MKTGTEEDTRNLAIYVQILNWFMDDPAAICPFSVHRMALIGKQLGKEVGEWFGPSTAAGAIKWVTSMSEKGYLVYTSKSVLNFGSLFQDACKCFPALRVGCFCGF